MSELKTQEYTVKKTQNNINITPDIAINFVNRRAINLFFQQRKKLIYTAFIFNSKSLSIHVLRNFGNTLFFKAILTEYAD